MEALALLQVIVAVPAVPSTVMTGSGKVTFVLLTLIVGAVNLKNL